MKTVSEWLKQHHFHEMYDAEKLQQNFIEETGKTDQLPSHSGYKGRLIYGYEMASFLADRYGQDRLYRRGQSRSSFLFRAAIDSIASAGN